MSELIFIGVLALIIIGPKELPQLARTLGRFINELKRSTGALSDEFKDSAGLGDFDLFDQKNKNKIRNPNGHDPQYDNRATPSGDAEADYAEVTSDESDTNNKSDEQLELVEQPDNEDRKPS